MASDCAPCVFGAASTSLISYPYDIVATGTIHVVPIISVLNGTSVTVGTSTTTEVPEVASNIVGPGGAPIVTITRPDALTWTTLRATLTYPTTYMEYLAFQGAAASGSACAQTLSPTALTLPSDVNSASLIYPVGDTGSGIPVALLDYLDSQGSIPSQLGGDQLTACTSVGASPAASVTPSLASSTIVATSTSTNSSSSSATPSSNLVPSTTTSVVTSAVSTGTNSTSSSLTSSPTSTVASSPSSAPTPSSTPSPSSTTTLTESNTTLTTLLSTSYSTQTTVVTTSTTLLSTSSTVLPTTTTRSVPPPPTTVTSPTSQEVVSSVVPTTRTITNTPALVFSTNTQSAIVISSSSTRTISNTYSAPPALAETMSSSASSGEINSSALGGLFSYLASAATSATSSSSPSSISSAAVTQAPVPVASLNTTGGSSVLVGPMTGNVSGTPYYVMNATSTTFAIFNATSTTYTVPYTGAAQKAAQQIGLGWLGGALGLALPALL